MALPFSDTYHRRAARLRLYAHAQRRWPLFLALGLIRLIEVETGLWLPLPWLGLGGALALLLILALLTEAHRATRAQAAIKLAEPV